MLALYLAEAELKVLFAQSGLSYDALTYVRSDYEGERVLSMNALREQNAALYERFRKTVLADVGSEPRDDRSMFLYTRLLRCMDAPKRLKSFLNLCDGSTKKRNHIVHRMYAISEEEFVKAIGKPEKLQKEIEAAIASVYPQCDRDVFNLYERVLAYIEDKR